jgi:hypothetical protein
MGKETRGITSLIVIAIPHISGLTGQMADLVCGIEDGK